MEPIFATLAKRLDDLLAALDREAAQYREDIAAVDEANRHGALNLVHYAYLRSHDVRHLQAGLAEIGATRLSTAEPAVEARLKVARDVVSAFLQEEELPYPKGEVTNAFARADEILEEHAEALLGPDEDGMPTRIMVTQPAEAANDPQLALDFAEAGMDLARLNCAHDDPATWKKIIDNVHAAAATVGRDIRISMDLAGPKVRTGAIAPGPAVQKARVQRLATGEVLYPARLWIRAHDTPAAPAPELPGRPAVSVQVDGEWLDTLVPGAAITFRDNRGADREFVIVGIGNTADGHVLAEGQKNAYLADGTTFTCGWARTRAYGIAPTEQRLRLFTGDRLVLTTDQAECDPTQQPPVIGCTLPAAVEAIEVGQPVLFDDGTIAARAVGKRTDEFGHTQVELEITRARPNGTNLAAYKGINLPETYLPLPSLTEEDAEALRFVAHHADIVAVSFVRDTDDVDYLFRLLDRIEAESDAPEKVRELGILLKIETIPGYENLPAILLKAMQRRKVGVMIARGDLAVELGFARMAEVPGFIMRMAEAAHLPVVMATQVLENLAKSGLPSRAEITDASYALRAEGVMLNKGPHIVDAIHILREIGRKQGRSRRKNRMLLRKVKSWDQP